MTSFFKQGLSLIIVATLAACSTSKSHQAIDDFSYLETEPLRDWTNLANQQQPASRYYSIPKGDFRGAVGEEVNILPPLQLLELIPAGQYKSDPYQATFLMPDNNKVGHMNEIIKLLISENEIPVLTRDEKGLETDWMKLNEDDDIQLRYKVIPIKQRDRIGVQISLLEAKRGSDKFEPDDLERERFNVAMANKFLLRYDRFAREEAIKQTENQTSKVALSMGTDRSGNSVIIARSPYNLFWNRLPTALQPLGFTLEERNRSQGLVDLSYSQPDEEIWSRIGVEPVLFPKNNYKLQLGDLGNRTSVNVLNPDGKPADKETLDLVYKALSAGIEYTNIEL